MLNGCDENQYRYRSEEKEDDDSEDEEEDFNFHRYDPDEDDDEEEEEDEDNEMIVDEDGSLLLTQVAEKLMQLSVAFITQHFPKGDDLHSPLNRFADVMGISNRTGRLNEPYNYTSYVAGLGLRLQGRQDQGCPPAAGCI